MKSLIVLVIDHDAFQADDPNGNPLTPEYLYDIGKQTNDMEAGIYGYEAWIVAHDVPEALLDQLAKLNIPAPE